MRALSHIKIKAPNTNCVSRLSIGGAGVIMDEHPSVSVFSPSKASSISSSGIFSMLKGFLLALIIKVAFVFEKAAKTVICELVTK